LRNEADWNSPLIQRYLAAAAGDTYNVVQMPTDGLGGPKLTPDTGEGSPRPES